MKAEAEQQAENCGIFNPAGDISGRGFANLLQLFFCGCGLFTGAAGGRDMLTCNH